MQPMSYEVPSTVIYQPIVFSQQTPPVPTTTAQNQVPTVNSPPNSEILNKLNNNSQKLKKKNKKLEGCKYEKVLVFNNTTMRVNTMLVCKYDNCNRQFKKSWDLLDHVRQHTGEKPYSCVKCNKKFAQRGNLVKHKRLHLQKEARQTS